MALNFDNPKKQQQIDSWLFRLRGHNEKIHTKYGIIFELVQIGRVELQCSFRHKPLDMPNALIVQK